MFSLSVGLELLTPAFPQYFLLLASVANIAKQISLACYLATSVSLILLTVFILKESSIYITQICKCLIICNIICLFKKLFCLFSITVACYHVSDKKKSILFYFLENIFLC